MRPAIAQQPVAFDLYNIFAAIRLQEWMDESSSVALMTSKTGKSPKSLRKSDPGCAISSASGCAIQADAEDLVQEVFYELVEANRLLMPIEHVTGWLFRVARNRITDLFRKKKARDLQRRSSRGRRRRTVAD